MHTVSRLIDYFAPEHYELSLDIDRTGRTFTGTVTIQGVALTNSIKLHAKDLVIEAVLIDGKTANFTLDPDDEVTLSQHGLEPGEHIIVVRFDGAITDPMHGLYPCYFEHAGVKKELLATQFESHHAREVFPCIDEPEAKASFDVTLVTEDGATVLGNMPVRFQDSDGRRLTTKFATTPRMSTYLLAFVIGELHKKSATTKDGIEVTAWATPAQPPESLDFGLDIAVRAIEYLNDYFETPYPLPKADLVALPDFGAGAMENWGLITFRESCLLADPTSTSISNRQYIASVIIHELAHQWFGNLVTMKWWNDLWLNESFATLMQFGVTDALYPEWNMWQQFGASQTPQALGRDATEGVQSVQIDVTHPDEVNTLFDGAIVYTKGARLLRMIRNYIGEDAFRQSLRSYFQKYAYNNTVGTDLWHEFSATSGKDIITIMNTWISQPGYPVVHITRQNGQVTLLQEQFFVGPHHQSNTIWPIPLTANHTAAPELLSDKTVTFASTGPLKLNTGDHGHFITHYDTVSFDALLGQIELQTLAPTDRIQVLNETIMLCRGGVLPSGSLIPLAKAYHNEPNNSVWDTLAATIGDVAKFVEDTDQNEQLLRQFAGQLASAQYERLGWHTLPGEAEQDTKLRRTIIKLMLYSQQQAAISKAQTIYHTTTPETMDAELRPLILASVVKYGDTSIINSLMQIHNSTASTDLRLDISAGVTATQDPEAALQLLNNVKNPAIVRPQDAVRWLIFLLRDIKKRQQTWDWIQHNWHWVQDTFGGDKTYDYFPKIAANVLTTRQQLQEYRDFFEPMLDDPSLARVIAVGISEITGRVELIEKDQQSVISALSEQ